LIIVKMEHEEQGKEECGMRLVPKGRRTKRYKSPFPSALQADGSCHQGNCFSSLVVGSSSPNVDSLSTPSPLWSQESSCEHTEEEQAVASYLLLLSNTPHHVTPINEALPIQFADAKSKNNTSKWIGPDGQVHYRCINCGRDFLSFQALGGHRASHKKPRLAQHKNDYCSRSSREVVVEKEEEMLKLSMNSFSMAIAKTRIHRCTICGCKFTSGQALGGHMRRHRNSTIASEAASSEGVAPDTDIKDEIEILEENETSPLTLDLNFPAPLDEKRVTIMSLSPEMDFHFL
jgi:C2H2-type zinc finger